VDVTLWGGSKIQAATKTLLMDSGGRRADGTVGSLDLARDAAARAGSTVTRAQPGGVGPEDGPAAAVVPRDHNWRIDVRQHDLNSTEEKTAFALMNLDVKARDLNQSVPSVDFLRRKESAGKGPGAEEEEEEEE
jgi:hypothetical protein